MIGKIITAAILGLILSVGAISIYAQPADMNITIADLAQNVTGNVTIVPLGNLTLANMTSQEAKQNQNQTELFQGLQNSTAILNTKIDTAGSDPNQTQRAEIKTALADVLKSMGDLADKVDTATNDQLQRVHDTSDRIREAIGQISD